ncbi:gp7 [Enterobacter cloacae]|uniref:Gp7 n=1 Tax=Enterobacter cloacae TaxID=550 RepID=A0A377M7E6_ENTCL|nr:gp7 [Enterobacter cloacae]
MGGLYTQEQIDAHYKGLEGTLAPLGHPQVNGQFVSAFSPEGINAGHIGAWNRNVKKSGNRIYLEKWVDVARAGESEGGRRTT